MNNCGEENEPPMPGWESSPLLDIMMGILVVLSAVAWFLTCAVLASIVIGK